ncbi:MAG: L,D-transpeptidase family protein [Candidatus Promineifilaceae bacterium]
MSTELSDQMELARSALERGEVSQARRMLRRIVHRESDNHRAWLWLAGVTDAPEASIQYIKRAQALEPQDPAVADAMAWAAKRLSDSNSGSTRLVAKHPTTFMPTAEVPQSVADERAAAAVAFAGDVPAATTQPPVAAEELPVATSSEAVPEGFSSMLKRTSWAVLAAVVIVLAIFLALQFFSGSADSSDGSSVEPLPMVFIDDKLNAPVAVAVEGASLVVEGNSAETPPLSTDTTVSDSSNSVEDDGVSADNTDPNNSSETVLQSLIQPDLSVDGNAVANENVVAIENETVANVVADQSENVVIVEGIAAIATPVPIGFIPKEAVPQTQPIAQWTPTPLPPTPVPTEAPVAAAPQLDAYLFNEARWIDVNLSTQYLTAYENGVPVFSTYISSGLPETPTVVGQFRIYLRLESQDMNGYQIGYDYYTPDVPYVMYFHGNYAIHGAYWHNNFGNQMSHGCVNTSVADGAWLFNFAGVGTLVNVHY